MAIFWQIRKALRHWALSWAAASYPPWHSAKVNDLCGQASQPEGGIRHHLFLFLLDPEKSSGPCSLGYSSFLPGSLIMALTGDPWHCILWAVAMSTWLFCSSCCAYWNTWKQGLMPPKLWQYCRLVFPKRCIYFLKILLQGSEASL